MNSLLKEVDKDIKSELPIIASKIVDELELRTPKDTGEAARSWESITVDKHSFNIVNDEDYIKYLNAGSSKQAPANFIEQTVLQYGTAKGNVVEYDN